MQLFCPTCQSAFTGLSRCPRCAGLLLMPEEAASLPVEADPDPTRPERPTSGGRLVVGTVAALGAYLAGRKFLSAWSAATGADPGGWWLSDDGLSAVLAAQALSAVFGALLAGAGRPAAFWLGAAVGAVTGALFLAGEVAAGAPPGHLVLLAQPAVLGVLGGVAGAVGGRVWSGLPELDMPTPAARRSSSVQLGEVAPKSEDRPTSWARVLVGAIVIVVGITVADPARKTIEKYSRGALRTASMSQAQFLGSQLAVLAVLLGTGAAAAGTGAGIRHGILAGLAGTVGMAGMALTQGALPGPAVYLIEHMGLDPSEPGSPAVLVALGFGLLVAGLTGGWLGGTLFLPLAPPHMRGRRVRLD